MASERLREAVERLGGRVEEQGDEVRLRFRERGFSLADLPRDALEELKRYQLVVIVEEGKGEAGTDYYYYIRRREVERLLGEQGG